MAYAALWSQGLRRTCTCRFIFPVRPLFRGPGSGAVRHLSLTQRVVHDLWFISVEDGWARRYESGYNVRQPEKRSRR